MAPEDLKSLFATFADTYAHVRLFRVNASDLILVGSGAPLPIDTDSLGKIFDRNAELTDDLARIDIHRPEHILGLYCCGRDTLRALVGSVERNTDDNMRIEYSAPLHLHEPTQEANSRLLERVAELPLEAVRDTAGIMELARAYARWDPSWRRALAALRSVQGPAGGEIDRLYRAYLAEHALPLTLNSSMGHTSGPPSWARRACRIIP